MENDFNDFFGEENQNNRQTYSDSSDDAFFGDEAFDGDETGSNETGSDGYDSYGYEDESAPEALNSEDDFYPSDGDQGPDDYGYTDGDVPPLEPEEAPAPKKPAKKKRSFKKRLRRFVRKLRKIPSKTLIVFGGGIAVLIIAVILIIVLLSKGCSAKKDDSGNTDTQSSEATVTDVPDATPTLPPLENTEDEVVTEEPEAHPLEGKGTQGSNGWYLKLNDDYEIIADIQSRLYDLGYMEIPVVDGKEGFTTKYGPSTKAAVRAFQYVNDLDVDGLLGQSSYDLLMSDSAKALQFSRTSPDSVFESYIEKMQTRLISLHYLSGEPTKKFEDKTMNALKQFQAKNGLTADGIAGQKTLEILYSSSALDATSSVTATAVPTVTE